MFERQGWRVLLSHHRSDQLHLCYRVGLGSRQVCLCARCAGLYPGLLLVLGLGRWTGPWPWWLDFALLFLAPLPALIEWGLTIATGKPERANWLRSLAGLGLGAGIGANLAYNSFDLLGYPVMAQFVYFLTCVWVVWMVSYARRSQARRQALIARLNRPGLQEFVLGPDQDQTPRTPQTR